MSNDVESTAERLWRAGRNSKSIPLSKGWWEDVARAVINRPVEHTLDHDGPTIEQISRRAYTPLPAPLHRGVDPRKVGYTLTMFERQYPGLHYDTVLESFWNYYIAQGSVSKNWFEKFLAYAQGALDRAKASEESGTDSLGRPLDPAKRRRVEHVPVTEEEQQEYLAKFRDDDRRLTERRARLEAERKAQEKW